MYDDFTGNLKDAVDEVERLLSIQGNVEKPMNESAGKKPVNDRPTAQKPVSDRLTAQKPLSCSPTAQKPVSDLAPAQK